MQRDIRKTPLYLEMEEHFRKAYEPAFGKISGAQNVEPAPDGRTIAFTGTRLEKLEGVPSTRVCLVDVETGRVDELTAGPNDDRLPRWSPDGTRLAFLSDRREKGVFQLYLLEAGRIGEAIAAPAVDGTIEYIAWSPDGRAIALGVAGRGADLAGVQGSGATKPGQEELPSWLPAVESGFDANQWRRLYHFDLATRGIRLLSRERLNVWEAAWSGPERLAAIASEDPSEDGWYSAPLVLIDLASGNERVIYRSDWQLAVPAASPSGQRLAVVEALCSDRAVAAGDLLLVDPDSGSTTRVDTHSVDVTHLAWRDENHLLYSGISGLHSAVGEYDAANDEARDLWDTPESFGSYYPEARPLDHGAFAAVREGSKTYPEIAVMANGSVQTVTSLSHPGTEYLNGLAGHVEEIAWTAPDGLEIQGFLVTPDGPGPFPLILNIHGGPVSSVRNRWQGVSYLSALVSRGYAVLSPNPRGSAGRGQEFARVELGDVGGAEMQDHLSGIDALVARKIADPARIGVTGGSHGGFMSSWIITQSDRFAAAVTVAPVTDWYSQHGTSNIGRFDRFFLRDDLSNPGGRYFDRSPVMFAHQTRTPTLVIAGGRDRCTPAGQAVEFYRALQEQGVESALAVYPEEGHGVRQLPAYIDFCTRAVDWFEQHMPPDTDGVRRHNRSD